MSVGMYTTSPAMGGAAFAAAPLVFRALGWAEPVPPGWGMGVCYGVSALYTVLAVGGSVSLGSAAMVRICMVFIAAGTIPATLFWWSHDAWLLTGLNGLESAVALGLILIAGKLFPAAA